jgi:hypothetical protein
MSTRPSAFIPRRKDATEETFAALTDLAAEAKVIATVRSAWIFLKN